MEQQNQKCTDLRLLVHSLSNHNINLILNFLDSGSIDSIISAGNRISDEHCKLISVARIKNFILKYLNKTDRSIYVPFYSEPHFANIENQQLAHLTTHQAQGLRVLSNSCQSLLQRLCLELNDFSMRQEALDSLIQSLTDPQLPFPKMRKQDIGMHCNSAFQFYLVDQLYSSGQEEEMEETFEELTKYLSQKWNLTPSVQKLEINIIEEVFYSWYKIGYENYQQYLLPSCTHHNLVVIVVALLDLFVDSFSFYLQSIEDPLYSFIEFNMRFCIFRNIILSLQSKLGFLFKSYSAFCADVLQKKQEIEIQQQGAQRPQVREMTIWHCGLSKWYIYMQHLHHEYFRTYFYLLKKASLNNIKEKNLQQIQDDETFIQLQNRLEINEVNLLEREKTFEVYSPIQDIFDQSPELYSQILKEYIQYIVDISVNEYSVHWCGHSSHLMHIPYQEFDRLVVQQYQTYVNKLQKIACSVSNPTVAMDSMLASMIEQLDKEYLKPVTLKKIIELSKEKVIHRPRLNQEQELEFSKMTSSIQSEIAYRDKVLEHFNNNAGISNEVNFKYSIVLESQDFAKMLKTSASTNASTTKGHIKMHSIRSSDSIMEQDFL